MKLKPNKKRAMKTGVLLAAAVIAGMTSNGVMGAVVPQEFNTPLAKLATAGASGFAASTVEGESTGATAVKGALLGVAVVQAIKGTGTLVAPKVASISSSPKVQNFINKAVGMGSAYRPMGLKSAALPRDAWKADERAVVQLNPVASRAI
jgi:hypothetical protein